MANIAENVTTPDKDAMAAAAVAGAGAVSTADGDHTTTAAAAATGQAGTVSDRGKRIRTTIRVTSR
jgi:hypothetical protein